MPKFRGVDGAVGREEAVKTRTDRVDNHRDRRQVTDGFHTLSRDVTSTTNRKLRVLGTLAVWIAALVISASPGSGSSANADDRVRTRAAHRLGPTSALCPPSETSTNGSSRRRSPSSWPCPARQGLPIAAD